MTFVGMKNSLSRDEMKKIMAGSDSSNYCTVPGTKCIDSTYCGGNCPNCTAVPGQAYSICAS
ncbi:MAG: hypothetical protein JWP44_5135 [Mucilaginibacter sp.]|nr:hypothetical protein [Mucilaginibacter sp.]